MKMVGAAQGIVSQNLDKVEAQIDSTVDNAKNFVHELRSETEEAVDRTLTRFTGFGKDCRKRSRLRWSSDPGLSSAPLWVSRKDGEPRSRCIDRQHTL